MDVKCIRCHSEFKMSVPDSKIKEIDCKEQTGTAIIEYVLEMKGWAQVMVKRKGDIPALYTVCPDCVEKDFESLNK